MSIKLKAAGAKRDPMMLISGALAILGAVQSATDVLKPVMADHSKFFGVIMFVISVTVATLRWYQSQTLVDKGIEAQQ